MHSESIQRKLLTEVYLNFDKAEKITVAMELAQRNAVDLQPSSSSGGIGVNKVDHKHKKKAKVSTSASKPAKECWQCGGDKHNANDCKFKSLKCFNCSKQGHSAKKCRSEKKKTGPVEKTSYLHQVLLGIVMKTCIQSLLVKVMPGLLCKKQFLSMAFL